jgi:hypothetical protein
MSTFERWDTTPGDLYDGGWRQCSNCKRWHQITQEDLDGLAQAIPDPERPNVVMLTNGTGDTCIDCGGPMGEYLPRDAIGKCPTEGCPGYVIRGHTTSACNASCGFVLEGGDQ